MRCCSRTFQEWIKYPRRPEPRDDVELSQVDSDEHMEHQEARKSNSHRLICGRELVRCLLATRLRAEDSVFGYSRHDLPFVRLYIEKVRYFIDLRIRFCKSRPPIRPLIDERSLPD